MDKFSLLGFYVDFCAAKGVDLLPQGLGRSDWERLGPTKCFDEVGVEGKREYEERVLSEIQASEASDFDKEMITLEESVEVWRETMDAKFELAGLSDRVNVWLVVNLLKEGIVPIKLVEQKTGREETDDEMTKRIVREVESFIHNKALFEAIYEEEREQYFAELVEYEHAADEPDSHELSDDKPEE